jgi:hypothetical protein
MALYEFRDVLTDQILNIVEWDGETLIETGSEYYLTLQTDPYSWTGSMPTNANYINIYGGEFYGVFHGLHDGDSTGTSAFSTTASYALTASYVSLDNVDHITFDTTPVGTVSEGTFVWNDGDGTLDLGLKGGNVTLQVGEQTYAMVYNNEATQLNVGEVVYITGAQGNRIRVERAYSDTDNHSANTLGFVAEPIAAGAEGLVITNGTLKKLNTNGLTAGAIVYLGSTPGTYTTTKPTAPTHTVVLGFIERVHLSVGSIYVKVDNGYELNELHNVLTPTPLTGDLLSYNDITNLWTNTKVLSGSYKLSGSLDVSGSITASLSGSLSGSVIGFFSGSGTGSFTGSFYGMFDGIKGGIGSTWQQAGLTYEYEYVVTFDNPYTNNNYSISVVGDDLRAWSISGKQFTGFTIKSNSQTVPTGNVYWTTVPFNS